MPRPSSRTLTIALTLSLMLMLQATDAAAARKGKGKGKPAKEQKPDATLAAHATLLAGIKSADFQARGMAYTGIAYDKKNKEVRQLLKDGSEDPQWIVRKGIALGYLHLKDPAWRKVVLDALAMPTLQPIEVLAVFDDMAPKDAHSVLIEALSDKESERQNAIVDAIVLRNQPVTGALIAAAIGAKSKLARDAGLRALQQMNVLLHGTHLQFIAKAHGKDPDVVKIIVGIAEQVRPGVDVSFLQQLKPKDKALEDRVTIVRAVHGERSVGKAVLRIAAGLEGDERVKALHVYRAIASKDDVAAVKALLGSGPSPRLALAVYEVLAMVGDRSMTAEAKELAMGTDVQLRPTGVYYLGRIGGAGRLPEMHDYLRDGIPDVRVAAARVLAHIASPVSVAPLREGLDNEREPRVKVELLKALAAIKDQRAYEALMFYTREDDDEVRRLVVRALAESGDKTTRSGLQNAVRDRSAEVRFEAIRGFLMSDPAQAVIQYKRALGWFPRGSILALTREFRDTFVSYLEIALFSERAEMREEAMDALNLLPQLRTELLKKVLTHSKDDDLTIRVLRRLFELEGKGIAMEIKTHALSSRPRVRIAAIRMLGQLGRDKEAVELLEANMSQPNPSVRIAAALTLVGG